MGERFQLKLESEDLNKGVKDFLLQVMEKNDINNIIVPLPVPSKKNIFPALVKKKEMLEDSKPLAPVLPVSTATMLSRITKLSPSPEKIIAFMKPCEIRATLELAKFKQIILDNVILISYDCMGAYETDYYEDSLSRGENIDSKYFSESLIKGKQDDNIRDACQVCEDFYPTNFADIGIGFIGTDGAVLIEGNTEEGKKLLSNLKLDSYDGEDREKKLEEISKSRKEKWTDKKEEVRKSVTDIDNFSTYFASCINCHNCMGECPICFCKECFWESPTFEFSPLNFLGWAERKGAVKLPTDTIFFHLGRLTHMSTSCISCGLCSDACPKDIEVHEIFHLVGDDTQAAFDYKPGRDLEEEAPLVTFLEEELEEMG